MFHLNTCKNILDNTLIPTYTLSSYLFVTEVVHPSCHIHSKLQQLLGGEGGGSAMFLGKSRVGLQDTALP